MKGECASLLLPWVLPSFFRSQPATRGVRRWTEPGSSEPGSGRRLPRPWTTSTCAGRISRPFCGLIVFGLGLLDDLRNLNQCATIGAEIARLNEALGPDTDEPPSPDGSFLSERAADAASAAALDAIRDAATDFIPGRSWIRQLSGAEQHSRHVQSAIQAGRIRRAFLKGTGMQRNCAPPAAPGWFRPRR